MILSKDNDDQGILLPDLMHNTTGYTLSKKVVFDANFSWWLTPSKKKNCRFLPFFDDKRMPQSDSLRAFWEVNKEPYFS